MAAGTINVRQGERDVTIVELDGEHDLYTAADLRDRLREGLDASHGLVVDLTAASFIDSSVVGVLLDGRQRARDAGKGFCVQLGGESAPAVRRIFEITGLIDSLPVVDNAEDAATTAASNGKAGTG